MAPGLSLLLPTLDDLCGDDDEDSKAEAKAVDGANELKVTVEDTSRPVSAQPPADLLTSGGPALDRSVSCAPTSGRPGSASGSTLAPNMAGNRQLSTPVTASEAHLARPQSTVANEDIINELFTQTALDVVRAMLRLVYATLRSA